MSGSSVRQQGIWDKWRSDLRVSVGQLVELVLRQVCGEAIAGFVGLLSDLFSCFRMVCPRPE